MLNEKTVSFLLLSIDEIKNNHQSSFVKIRLLKKLFKSIFVFLTENEQQLFSSHYARISFVLNKYHLTTDFAKNIRKFNYKLNNASRSSFSENIDLDYFISFIENLINVFSKENPHYVISLDDEEAEQEPIQREYYIRCIVKKKANRQIKDGRVISSELVLEKVNGQFITLVLYDNWKSFWNLVTKNSTIHLINVENSKNENNKYYTNSDSFIVYEPDFLVDVTEISECFGNYGANEYIYFLHKFVSKPTSYSLILGNIVNSIFDALIENSDADFETVIEKAYKNRPLQIFSLAYRKPEQSRILKQDAFNHFLLLKKIVRNFDNTIKNIEPSFISPLYGLQGRLDLLLEYEDDENRKDIIELKSGIAPSIESAIRSDTGIFLKTGIRNSHLAQISCYNLLLDSTFKNRSGNSAILYSKDELNPLRDAPNIHRNKQNAIIARNWIVALELSLMKGGKTIFEAINVEKFGEFPPFLNEDILRFQSVYQSSRSIDKAYFHNFVSFIIREQCSEKFGTGKENSNGFSALWLDSDSEKSDSMQILTGLELESELTDFEKLHLVFKRSDENCISIFRKGDSCILSKTIDNSESSHQKQYVKCTIKSINPEQLVVSLRNKLFNKSYFDHSKFAIEADYIDSTSKKMMQGLFRFLELNQEKRDVILGLKTPETVTETTVLRPDYLNDNQYEILQKVITAKDYFLIQGPPGTGKTSFMLRSIVEYYFKFPSYNILLIAFTNRAVDEICSSISRIIEQPKFIRLGSKESSSFEKNLLSKQVDEMPLREVYKNYLTTRIVISTSASALSNPELFETKRFDLLIADEAAQILEPQIIDIISRVDKFILIGDEKQLPAIVIQPDSTLNINNEELHQIGIQDLRSSLFERLLKTCKSNNWNHSYDMLKFQARMHSVIQTFPNKMYYNNQLRTLEEKGWQQQKTDDFSIITNEPIEWLLSQWNVIFIETEKEKRSKVNLREAALVAELSNKIFQLKKQSFNNSTLGIISPFRAQCSAIYKNLSYELRDVITIDTVERFQGSERDIIILSTATNSSFLLSTIQSLTKNVDLNIDRKLNVAITRSKKYFIMFGCPEILSESRDYHAFLNFVSKRGKFISVHEINNFFPSKDSL
ncbi:MAG: AAA domain-containing protein [Candidatus Kapabacteria bacterium]|nr:AAA domain-containing protein [Candidatus Kapabacteria bacterium]